MLDQATAGFTWGDAGLVGFCVVLTLLQLRMIFSGKFVPREQVDLMLAGLRDRVTFLEGASAKKDDTIYEQAKQIAQLTPQAELSVRLLGEIASRTADPRPGGGYVAQAD